jgi:hypothetical protein
MQRRREPAGPASDQQVLRQRTPRLAGASTVAHAHSEQHKQPPQFYPNGQFHLLSSSPVALTPSLSPLYRPPHLQQKASHGSAGASAAAAAASAAQTAVDEEIGQLFTMHLPVFFDALEKFQYHQVL